jgi:ABC-type nitrate/sulfonate/bicarbonate transport system substrate-binding protein
MTGYRIGRRAALAGAAAATLPRFAIAQGTRRLSLTTSWLPEGPNLFAYVARDKGFWTARGLDVSVARGSGSGTAAQATGAGTFDFGMSATPTVIQQASQGLPIVCIGQSNYSGMMGVGLLADSPIKTPKDLEGRTLGSAVTSGEYPFLPLYAKLAGFDLDKVKQVQLDPKVRDRTLMDKQVDAATGFGTSMIPALGASGVKLRLLSYEAAGLHFYGQSLITQQARLADKGLVQAFVDGAMEGMIWSMTNFDEAIDIFMKANDEVSMSKTGREYTRLGLGLTIATNLVPEVREHAFGWADPAKVKTMAEQVVTYATKEGTKVPDTDKLFTNDFVTMKLDAAQLAKAEATAQPFMSYLG